MASRFIQRATFPLLFHNFLTLELHFSGFEAVEEETDYQ